MFKIRKATAVFLLVLILSALPLQALAEKSDKEPATDAGGPVVMTLDLALARPLGFVATLAGMVVFVVSVPFSALGGNTGEAWDTLVATPAEYTFQRPLGHFE